MIGRHKQIILFLYWIAIVKLVLTAGQQFDIFSNNPSIFNDDFTSENVHFFGPPSESFWREFWDTFNYKGPLQENPFFRPVERPLISSFETPVIRPLRRPVSVPYFSNSGLNEQYPGEEYIIPERETKPVRQEVTEEQEDEYNRYRDYFYRRYGTNFVD